MIERGEGGEDREMEGESKTDGGEGSVHMEGSVFGAKSQQPRMGMGQLFYFRISPVSFWTEIPQTHMLGFIHA